MEQPVSRPTTVRIREVGPRDGIQSERTPVATRDKIRLVDALSQTGVKAIETASFVAPKALPQMADAADVFAGIQRRPDVFYSALVPNARGARAAIDAGADGLQVFIAATDSYNLKNVRRTVKESIANVAEVAELARDAAVPVEATISTAFGCPYEGDVAPDRVAEVTGWVVEQGITTISYGDTTGMGTPARVEAVVQHLRTAFPDVTINLHLHDTRGTGLANVLAALDLGIDYFDASVGGMGGSPFAQGATGNIATEDLVHMLEDMNISTEIDIDALLEAARLAQSLVDGDLPSKLLRAGPRWAVAGRVTEAT